MTTRLIMPAQGAISCDFDCHKARRPASTEPGTDVALDWGTPLLSPLSGTVWDIKTTNTGAMGRVVYLRGDDGTTWVRLLHFQRVDVKKGQRVVIGVTRLGLSGASGNGADHWPTSKVGYHVHITLWVNRPTVPTPGVTPPVDFEKYLTSGSGAGGGEADVVTAAEAKMIAQAVWATKVNRKDGPVSAIQELADAKSNTIELLSRTAPVVRGGEPVPMRQEWADSKTLGIQNKAMLETLVERPAGSAPELTEEQLDAIAEKVASKIPAIDYAALAKAVNDDAAARLRE